MIVAGEVNARLEAVVRVRLRGPSGAGVSAIADTGFCGQLALPAAIAANLGLPKRTTGTAKMGDGSPRGFDVFAVEVWWADGRRTVSAAAIGREPLVGMRLLAGHRLTIDVTSGGAVDVVPLSQCPGAPSARPCAICQNLRLPTPFDPARQRPNERAGITVR